MLDDQDPPHRPDEAVLAWYDNTVCGRCGAGQLLQWDREKSAIGGSNPPLHADYLDDHWVAVHCDYFKRRIEKPNRLTYCAALRPHPRA